MTIAPHAGLRIGVDEPDNVQMAGEYFSHSLIDDERPLTELVHLDARASGRLQPGGAARRHRTAETAGFVQANAHSG